MPRVGDCLPALKKEFDAMPEIADPRAKLQEVKERYEPSRTKLLEADSKWADAAKDVKAKKDALDEVKHKFTEANMAANKAKPRRPRPRLPLPLLPRPRLPRMRAGEEEQVRVLRTAVRNAPLSLREMETMYPWWP